MSSRTNTRKKDLWHPVAKALNTQGYFVGVGGKGREKVAYAYTIANYELIFQLLRQIWVWPEDRDLLRIAYRFDQIEPIQTFRLKTVTYGLNCAPFLAMRCLLELAYEASADHPQAVKMILNSFYMDNMLVGLDKVTERYQVTWRPNQYFELYKWASNETKLLPNQDSENNTAVVRFDGKFETKALGLTWNCQRDLFKYCCD